MRTYFARLQKVVSYTRVFTVLTALFDFAVVTVGQRGWTLYHQRSFIHFSLKPFEPDLLLIRGSHSILFSVPLLFTPYPHFGKIWVLSVAMVIK